MTKNLVAIVDHGLGNLFSVRQACSAAGMDSAVTADVDVISGADAVILPGVGAFAHAMDQLRATGLIPTLRDVAASGRPLIGICLGMQLLMEESLEYGLHEGLGLIAGRVEPLITRPGQAKVPQIAWNEIRRATGTAADPWEGTPLHDLPDGVSMYFVHSYRVVPSDPDVSIAVTTYGGVDYCSALRSRNIFGLQFHPERSAAAGLQVYENISRLLAGVAA